MGDPNEDSGKDEYATYRQDVKELGQRLHQQGSAIQRQGAEYMDLADAALKFSRQAREKLENSQLSGIPRQLLDSKESLHPGGAISLAFPLEFPVHFSGGTAQYVAASALASAVEDGINKNRITYEEISPFHESLVQFTNKYHIREQVVQELKRIGFEASDRGKEALSQFENAWITFLEIPPTPTASLLSLRGALDAILGRLVAWVPACTGKEHKKDRIVCIGKEAGFDHKTPAEWKRLQARFRHVTSQSDIALSSNNAKQGTLSREQESTAMIAVTTLLLAILKSIDEKKLKP